MMPMPLLTPPMPFTPAQPAESYNCADDFDNPLVVKFVEESWFSAKDLHVLDTLMKSRGLCMKPRGRRPPSKQKSTLVRPSDAEIARRIAAADWRAFP